MQGLFFYLCIILDSLHIISGVGKVMWNDDYQLGNFQTINDLQKKIAVCGLFYFYVPVRRMNSALSFVTFPTNFLT